MLNYVITNKINKNDLKIFNEFAELLNIEKSREILENNLCTILFFEKECDFYCITSLTKPFCSASTINSLFFTDTNNSKSITFAILQTIQIGLSTKNIYKIKLTLPHNQSSIAQHCNMLGFKIRNLEEHYELELQTLSRYAKNLIDKYNL